MERLKVKPAHCFEFRPSKLVRALRGAPSLTAPWQRNGRRVKNQKVRAINARNGMHLEMSGSEAQIGT